MRGAPIIPPGMVGGVHGAGHVRRTGALAISKALVRGHRSRPGAALSSISSREAAPSQRHTRTAACRVRRRRDIDTPSRRRSRGPRRRACRGRSGSARTPWRSSHLR
jgi:hypothetical protein